MLISIQTNADLWKTALFNIPFKADIEALLITLHMAY